MRTVSVKAVEGRIARTSPRGELIPSDRFVHVNHTAYIERLIRHHGDLLVEPKVSAPKKESEPAASGGKKG